MENKNQSNYDFSSINLLAFLYQKRVPLIIITLLAAVASAVVSMLITPKYESSIVFFPATTSSVSKPLLDNTSKDDVLQFGGEEDAEQVIQVLQSDRIQSEIIEKYNLMEHYGIDPESKFRWTLLNRKYKENINVRKTKFMSIEVSVKDHDPEMAAAIAEDIGNYLDSSMNEMQNEVAMQAFEIVKREYLNLKKDIKAMEDSIQKIAKEGLYDYESQSQALNEAYAEALATGNRALERRLKKELDVLAKYGGVYLSLTEQLDVENRRLSKLKAKYTEAKVDAESNLPHKFMINRAYVPEKKATPRRTMIVVVSTVSAFLLAFLLMLIIENFKKMQRENVI